MQENTMKLSSIPARWCLAILIIIYLSACSDNKDDQAMIYPDTLPDLSGLSWIEDDLFIGVHDAKNNSEKENWPRASLIRLPQSELDGVIWEPVALNFPGPGGASSDMESACSIPGGKDFLFVESGQEGEQYRRIFLAEYDNGDLWISSYIDWPVEVVNVEATEVCQVGEKLVFLFAERAQDSSSTQLRWAEISIAPLGFGEFSEVTYEAVDPVGPGTRPIVALEVDNDGYIYIVSAYDSGNDGGPYRSVVWQIGRVTNDGQGKPVVELGLNNRLADLDGLKVESVAVRESSVNGKEIYIGTDDEHYGGILRLLPEMP